MSSSPLRSRLDSVAAINALASVSLLRPNPKLDNAVSNSARNGLPPITVSPLQGQFLALHCKLINAKSVLEIGTLGGYGTIWFAQAGVKVTSIEVDPKFRDVAIENVKGLDAEIILGAALDVLPKLAEEGRKFDMILIDALWEEQWDYFQWAVKLTHPKGIIYIDNVVRALLESGATDASQESIVTKVGRDKRVSATLIPVVSISPEEPEDVFDGFLFAVVN